MKKNTKSTAGGRKTRHAKSATKKPVTIDLKAEKVENQTASKDAKATAASSAKKSTPKVKSSASGFGRDAKSQTSDKEVSATKAQASKPAKPETAEKKTEPALKSAATSEKSVARSQKSGSGLFGKFAAAVVGGVVALGGAAVLQKGGYIPALNEQSTDYASSIALTETRSDLLSKVEALQSRLNEAEAKPGLSQADVDAAVDARIKQMQAENPTATPEVGKADIEALDGKITATGAIISAMQDQVAKAEAAVNEMKQAISSGKAGEEAGLSAVGSRLDLVDTTLTDIGTKLAAIDEKTAKPDGTTLAAIAALQAALPKLQSGFEEKIAGINEQVTATKEEAQSLVAPLQKELETQIETLTEKINSLTERAEQLATSTQAANEKVAALQSSVDESVATEKKAARAIAAAAVKSAIDSGVSFEEELATLKDVAGESENLTALEPYAESGVPTQTQLAAQYAQLSEIIIAALTPKPQGNLSDRLMAAAKGLVTIKSESGGDTASPRDQVMAIGKAVSDGDLNRASDLWSALPDAGKTVSDDWHKGLQARMSANQLVEQTVQTYLLSGSGQ